MTQEFNVVDKFFQVAPYLVRKGVELPEQELSSFY